MTASVILAAGWSGVLLGVLALSMFALLRVRSLEMSVRREVREARQAQLSAVEALGGRVEALAARLEDIRTVPHGGAFVSERRGINLTRRSQALRMHRRGESVGQIAADLGIPVQEVQLLIKVHEIVMSTV